MLKLRRGDGSLVDGQCDAAGNLKVAVAAATDVASFWVDPETGVPLTHARLIAEQGGRRVFRIVGSNEGPERRWFMLFDLAALPAANAQPALAYPVAAGAPFVLEFPRARVFQSGIAWGASVLPTLYTPDLQAAFRVNLELA